MRSIRFQTAAPAATEYVIGSGARTDPLLRAALDDRPLAVIVDEEVAALHPLLVADIIGGNRCLGMLELGGGEQVKTFAQLEAILRFLDAVSLPKHGAVVAIGGGTICDVVGVSAMLMRRSVPLVLVPTTLLSQVDAAIGGKNGINTETTKNLIGHFYHPTVVVCDEAFLSTLPPREIVSGIAECIKVFAVADPSALATHVPRLAAIEVGPGVGRGADDRWRDAVWDAVRWKLHLLEDDPYERSSKRLLNYGHAFAHLFEERAGFRILHGEAVLLGMMVENEISIELMIGGSEVVGLQEQIEALLTPACREWWVPFPALGPELDRLRRMRSNALNLVCLRELGDAVIVDDIPDEVLRVAWENVEARLEVPSRRRDHAG